MLVTVNDWYTEKRTSAKGKSYDVTVFKGIKHGYQDDPDEDWEKALVTFGRDGEFAEEIKSYGKGAQLLIRHERRRINDRQLWKIIEIEPWGDTEVQVPNDGAKKEIPQSELALLEMIAKLKAQVEELSGGKDIKSSVESDSELKEPELPDDVPF